MSHATPPPEHRPLRVALADDAALLREGLKSILAAHGVEVCAEAADATELMRAVHDDPPDAVVTDIRMPPSNVDEGLQAAERLGQTHPRIGVLVLSQYLEPSFALRLLEHSVPGRGYLLKERVPDVDTFLDALRTVAHGGSYVDPAIVQRVLGRHDDGPLGELTRRELDILELMAEGRSNGAICERLFLSPKTVEGHVRSIFMKLELPPAPDDHRRVLAVLRYLRSA